MSTLLKPLPLAGDDKDEILAMVSRIKRADDRLQSAHVTKPPVAAEDVAWAEDMQLPSAFFEFFTLDRAA